MLSESLALKLLRRKWGELTARERRVIESLANRHQVSRDVGQELDEKRTFGERVADSVAKFGGSWTFIIIFAAILIGWVALNTFVLANRGAAPFDPYPYILLNLFLSMLAAVQAPIIMMSQNRQAARDRLDAANDYEVNLKSELEIHTLHEKLDELRDQKWFELIKMQQEQIKLLESLLGERPGDGRE